LKSLDDALEIRRRMLMAFEIAEKTADDEMRKAAMTFVVVGAGPTGVEMAGAISEIARVTLVKDFRHIDASHGEWCCSMRAPRVLPVFTPTCRKARGGSVSTSASKCGLGPWWKRWTRPG